MLIWKSISDDERFKQEMASNVAMFRKSTTEVYDKFTQQNTTKRTVYENMSNGKFLIQNNII